MVSKNIQTSNNKAIQKLYKNNDIIDMHFDITKSDLLSKCKYTNSCILLLDNTIFQINHQPDATIFQFIILTFIYSSTCVGRSPAHHQELNDCSISLWFYLHIVVIAMLCSWSAQPRTQHSYHHDTKVKPEAANAVTELLMMDGRTPKRCWAVNKRQDNKLENCCIWLVIYLNCMMMHRLTNLKYNFC